jgi:hypothetical protein
MNNPSSFDLGACASMPQPPRPRKSVLDKLGTFQADLKVVGLEGATEPPFTVPGVFLGETNPIALGDRVVSGLRSTVRAVIDACVLITETVRRFEGDRESLDEFLDVLADGNVIPRKQARLGSKSSKLSKLRKIGDYAELLCRDEIIEHLEPGYTINYHVTLLYDALAGDEDARVMRLVQILEAEGGLSREFLIQQTRLAEQAARLQADPEADLWSADTVSGRDREFDLILFTPTRRDLQRLGEDYAGEVPWRLRVHERVAVKAAAVVIAKLADFPTIASRLLPSCGFEDISHVFLVREPVDADVTGAQVIVIAERGVGGDHIPDFQWLTDGESLDDGYLASRLVPNAKNKLHAFASAPSDGWCSILGEANWGQSDA